MTRTSRVTRPHAVQKLLIHAEALSRSTTLPHLLHLYFTSKPLLYAVWNTPSLGVGRDASLSPKSAVIAL